MEILLKSIFSGVLIGVVLFITKLFGPKVGGIVAMVPLMFTLAFLFSTYGKNSFYIQDFILSGIIGTILFVVFLAVLYFLNKNSDKYCLNLAISYAVWFGGSFLWIYFKK